MKKAMARAVGSAIVGVIGIASAGAADNTWDGTGSDGSWTNPANWGGAAPGATSNLFWGGTTELDATNDFDAFTQFDGLTFNSGAGAFVLSGNALTLGGNIANNSANLQTVNLGLVLGAGRTFAGGTGGLAIGGAISNSAASGTQTLQLTGNGTLGGAITSTGGGILDVQMNDIAGTWAFGGSGSLLTNSGFIRVTAGTLDFGNGSDAPMLTMTYASNKTFVIGTGGSAATFNMKSGTLTAGGGEALTMGNGTGASTLNVTGGTLTLQNEVNIANESNSTSTVNLYGGTLNASALFRTTRGTATITITNGALTAGILNLGGGHQAGQNTTLNLDGGTLTVGAIADGGGGQTHAVTNYYNGGTLKFSAATTVGNYSSTVSYVKNGGAVVDTSGNNVTIQQPFLQGPGGSTGGLTKNGAGTLTLSATNSFAGNTVVNAGTLQLGVPTTPLAGSLYRLDAATTGSVVNISGAVSQWTDQSGNGRNFVQATANNQPLLVANGINGLPAVQFDGTSDYLVQTGSNTPLSVFIVNAAGPGIGGLRGIWGQIGDYGIREEAGGWYGARNSGDFINGVNGVMYTNGVAGDGNNLPVSTSAVLLEAVRTNGTTAFASTGLGEYGTGGAANRWYNGKIGEVIAYGTALSTTDRQLVEAYLLAKWFGTGITDNILPTGTSVDLAAAGATLDVGFTKQTVASLTGVAGSAVLLNNGGRLTVNNSSDATFAGAMSGLGSFAKSGAGTYTLTGTNTHSGGTTVSGGTLRIGDGTANGSVAGNITNNATLVFANATAQNHAGNISGSGGLVKTGAGVLTLNQSSNIFSGGAVVSNGTLRLYGAPSVPASGYARWFDASTLATITTNGAGKITQWNDLSGNGANAANGTGSRQPTYTNGVLNGLGAVHLYGTGANDAGEYLTFTQDTAIRAVFSVFKGNSFILTDAGAYDFHRASDTNPADPLFNGSASANVRNGTNYVNGVLVGATTTAMPTGYSNGFNLVEILTAGNVTANGFNRDRVYHNGDQYQAEVLLYNTTLTEAQRLQNEAYLNYKWFGIGTRDNILPAATAVSLAAPGATLELTDGLRQTVGSLSGVAGSVVTLNNASRLTVNNGTDGGFAGGLTGAGAFVKTGAGMYTLTGTNTHTGGTTVSGGTLRVGDGTVDGAIAGNITNDATLVFQNVNAQTYGGRIAGSGGLTKTGAGVLTITNASSFLGATVVSNGTLQLGVPTAILAGSLYRLDAAAAGSVVNVSGAVSQWTDQSGNGRNFVQATGNNQPLLVANGINGLPAVQFDGSNDQLVLSGSTTPLSVFIVNTVGAYTTLGGIWGMIGDYGIRENANNSWNSTANDGDFINAWGGTANGYMLTNGVAGAGYTVGTPHLLEAVRTNSSTVFASTGLGEYGTGGAAGRYYNGKIGEVVVYGTALSAADRQKVEAYLMAKWFGTGITENILPSGTAVNLAGAGATLDVSFTKQTVASLTGVAGSAVLLGSGGRLTVNNAVDAGFGGAMSGAGSLVKTGAGIYTLTGTNTHTGGTTIGGGTLRIGDGSVNGSLAGAITNNAALVFANATAQTSGNSIAGTGGLTKTGTGVLSLTSTNNTYAGPTTISGGTLKLQPAPSAPVSGYARWFDASSTANVTTNGSGKVTQWADLSGYGANAVNNTGTRQPTYAANAVNGLGAVHLYGTGANDVGEYLLFNSDTSIRTVFSVFKGSSFLLTESGSLYDFHRPNDTDPRSPIWASYASASVTNGQTYVNGTLVNGTSYNMPTNTNNGFNLVELVTTGNVTANGFNKDRVYHNGDQYQAEVLLYNSVLSDTDRRAVEAYLNHKWFGGGSVLPTNTAVDIAAADAILDLNGFDQGIGSLGGIGLVTNGSALTSDFTVGNNASNTTFTGVIGGAIALTKTGAGTQTLGGNNTYTGGTTLKGGKLEIGADANLGAAAGALTFDGGLLRITGTAMGNLGSHVVNTNSFNGGFDIADAGHTFTLGVNLSGAGNLTKDGPGALVMAGADTRSGGTIVSNGTLRVGNGATAGSLIGGLANYGTVVFDRTDAVTHAGVISGTGTVVKVQANTLTLTADSSAFAGGMAVSNGILKVNGQMGGLITVYSNATLAGTGTVDNVTIAGDGRLSPGASTGILTIDGDATLQSNAVLSIELGGYDPGTGFDQIVMPMGVFNLDEGAVLDVSFSDAGFEASVTNSSAFAILNGWNAGTFTIGGVVRNSGDQFAVGSKTLEINYNASDITLTVVPEPATAGLLGFCVIAAWLRRRLRD